MQTINIRTIKVYAISNIGSLNIGKVILSRNQATNVEYGVGPAYTGFPAPAAGQIPAAAPGLAGAPAAGAISAAAAGTVPFPATATAREAENPAWPGWR